MKSYHISVIVDQTTSPKFAYKIHIFHGNPNDLASEEWYWDKPILSEYMYRSFDEAKEEAEKHIESEELEIPRFVKIKFNDCNSTELRLVKGSYFRDAGNWGVDYKFVDGVLVSWGKGMPWLHNKPLIKITEDEWREGNRGYIDLNEDEDCPECGESTIIKPSGMECIRYIECGWFSCY